MELRLGAIYALERIARDSWKDHWPIMEVLTAYIRENSSQVKHFWAMEKEDYNPTITPDIQAAITVIGRRNKMWIEKELQQNKRLDLSNCNLHKADFSDLNYDNATFAHSSMSNSKFIRTELNDARIVNCELRGAEFKDVIGCNVTFIGSIVPGLEFLNCNFNYGRFKLQELKNAQFKYCSLNNIEAEESTFYTTDFINCILLFDEIDIDDEIPPQKVYPESITLSKFEGCMVNIHLTGKKSASNHYLTSKLTEEQINYIFKEAPNGPFMRKKNNPFPTNTPDWPALIEEAKKQS